MNSQQVSSAWREKVVQYVSDLEVLCGKTDQMLERFDLQKNVAQVSVIEESTAQLATAVGELESMVAIRESLLRDVEAPRSGSTLIEKLKASGDSEDRELAERCEAVARTIETVHQRTISLFVCQFHLADLTRDILGILAGSTPGGTYERDTQGTDHQSSTIRQSEGAEASRGGLFNEAG